MARPYPRGRRGSEYQRRRSRCAARSIDARRRSLTAMPGQSTLESAPDIVSQYFEADARRDTEAILSLFRKDAVVMDESRAWHGNAEIRAWRLGPVSKYDYTTTI